MAGPIVLLRQGVQIVRADPGTGCGLDGAGRGYMAHPGHFQVAVVDRHVADQRE